MAWGGTLPICDRTSSMARLSCAILSSSPRRAISILSSVVAFSNCLRSSSESWLKSSMSSRRRRLLASTPMMPPKIPPTNAPAMKPPVKLF